MIDYLEIASRTLERWHSEVELEPKRPALPREALKQAMEKLAAEFVDRDAARDEIWIPYYEWKARELNRLFLEQGATGQAGHITAETVRDGYTDGTIREVENRQNGKQNS